MVQDRIPVQDIPVQEQFFPQLNPEPEMGAAAAVAYDTSPSLLQNPPPIPAETVHPSVPDMAQICAMLAGVTSAMQQMQKGMDTSINGMEKKMETNACRMENKMDGNTKKMEEMRGEMQKMGHGLQAGIMAISCSETRTARKKLAMPRAATNELEERLHGTDGVKDAHTQR